jgi:hypothetical protein
MTVLIYVNTSKQVGDPDHLKVFAHAAAAETWLQENMTPKAWHSNMRSWSEARPPGRDGVGRLLWLPSNKTFVPASEPRISIYVCRTWP